MLTAVTGAVTFYDRHYQRLGKSKIASGVGADCRGLLGGPVPLHSTPGLPGELRCAQRCPVDRTKPMQSELQVGAPGGQQQRFYLPPGQVAAALGEVAAEIPPRSCSGRHRRCCSAWGCPGPVLPPGAPSHSRLCADLLHALFRAARRAQMGCSAGAAWRGPGPVSKPVAAPTSPTPA